MTSPIPKSARDKHKAIIGKTGSGKTTVAKGEAEDILDEGGRLCVVDPTGAWWGLKSSSSGKRGAYPVVIFGGDHADLPLEGTHGETLAEIIGTSSTPTIIDTSLMKVRDRTQFFTDFADGLMRKNRGPLHLMIDECHVFMPQGKVSDPRSGEMLHAANNLISGGRSRGLRVTLISQRPAKVHKDALTQVETMIAMRLVAPQDRNAFKEWIADNADDERAKEIITSLAGLKTGEGWIWSPELELLERVKFPPCRTFDSSRAPDGNEGTGPVLAPIDRDDIAQRLKAVAADALANDPKELKKQVAQLQRQIASAPIGASNADVDTAYKSGYDTGCDHGFGAGQQSAFRQFEALRLAAVEHHARVIRDLVESVQDIGPPELPAWTETKASELPPGAKTVVTRPKFPIATPPRKGNGSLPSATKTLPSGEASASLDKMSRAMLIALAQHPRGLTKGQILVHTGYRASGHVSTAFANLIREDWASMSGERMGITHAGLQALGQYEPLPVGEELRDHLLNGNKCSTMEKAMLRVAFDRYPEHVGKGEILEVTGYSASGHVSSAFARLVTLGYLTAAGSGQLRASEDLFT